MGNGQYIFVGSNYSSGYNFEVYIGSNGKCQKLPVKDFVRALDGGSTWINLENGGIIYSPSSWYALKEVDVERNGKTVRLNQGEVAVFITGYLVSDYEQKWEKNAIYYLIRGLFDKYVWRVHTYRAESGLVDECNHLSSQIKAFLNLYRYQEG